MKKYFIIILLFLFPIQLSAEIITGGNISINGSLPSVIKDSEIGISAKTNSIFNFTLTPRVGYLFLENKLEAGGAIGFSYNLETDYIVLYQLINEKLRNGEAFKDLRIDKFTLAFSPYVRYQIVLIKKFGIWFEGVVTLSTVLDKGFKYYPLDSGYNKDYQYIERTLEEADKLNNIELNLLNKNLTWGIVIKPILTKDINEHWRLETGLNFMCLGITGVLNKTRYFKNGIDDSDGYIAKQEHICNYTIGVWNGDVINIGILTIGAVYKF